MPPIQHGKVRKCIFFCRRENSNKMKNNTLNRMEMAFSSRPISLDFSFVFEITYEMKNRVRQREIQAAFAHRWAKIIILK